MNLTVYSQLMLTLDDNTTVIYSGEDARPYVDDQILFVADGLGGSSSLRHTQFDTALLEKDKIMDALFQGIYEDYADERFVNYVTDSFFELFAIKDCYSELANCYKKKSSYFGSRIAAAVLLHKIIYDETVKPDSLFEQYNSLKTLEEKEAFLKKTGDDFARGIENDMREIAKKVNLFKERPTVLLGTTLCATIYRENEEQVEALYLTAGDSRPYVWTEEEGLAQLLKDQERESDGVMTNYICVDDNTNLNIRCDYMCFKKPCVLFNATDGCFDCNKFYSQMAFEKLILDTAKLSVDISEMIKSLTETFNVIGDHDDSSTMAMRFFGYESLDAFKESASRRLDAINNIYLSKFPELLDKDYVQDYENNSKQIRRGLSGLKVKLDNEEAVKSFSIERMKCEHFAPYEQRIKAIDAQIVQQNRRIEQASIQIKDIVAKNFISFVVRPICQKTFFWFNDPVYKVQHIEQERQEQTEIYKNMIEHYRTDLDETTARMKALMDRIFEIGVPADFSRYDDIDMSCIEDLDRSISSLIRFFYQLKNKNHKSIKKISKLRKEYIENNQKLASDNQIKLQEICDKIISGEDPRGMINSDLLPGDLEALQRCVADFNEADANIAYLNTDEKKNAETEFGPIYWDKNYVEIISLLAYDSEIEISEELRNEAKSIIEDYNNYIKDLKAKADLQTELFRQYELSYSRYIGESDK